MVVKRLQTAKSFEFKNETFASKKELTKAMLEQEEHKRALFEDMNNFTKRKQSNKAASKQEREVRIHFIDIKYLIFTSKDS